VRVNDREKRGGTEVKLGMRRKTNEAIILLLRELGNKAT